MAKCGFTSLKQLMPHDLMAMNYSCQQSCPFLALKVLMKYQDSYKTEKETIEIDNGIPEDYNS